MKLYIKSSLNSELHNISVSSINGGSKSELARELKKLLAKIPVSRYILVIGDRGYNTGYFKSSENSFKWLYNGEKKSIDSYWETKDSYIILPSEFKIGSRIDFDDDKVVVWEVSGSDNEVYRGLEDYEPMKDEDWRFCADLGLYYLVNYSKHTMYIKAKVAR